MKTEYLQAFVAAAEKQSFSLAGAALYLSQPTISRYIGELEKHLGTPLFLRNAHTCELTPTGKQVYLHAKRILNECDAIDALKQTTDHRDDVIRIGYTFHEMMPRISAAIMQTDAGARGPEISLRFGDGSDICRRIREGLLECGVMHLPSVPPGSGLTIRLISKCGMCVYIPETHHLAARKGVKLEQLIHETDVRTQNEKNYYRMTDEAFKALNLPETKHRYVEHAADCMPIVRYKNLICFTPALYPAWPGCVKIPIEDWTTDFSLVFVTRPERETPYLDALCRALRTAAPPDAR
ncbi:MAG: LysR family transcriptional regulator [Clostridia bacterium]|nr:LysR family transcriptional regulator [Clostridia bacterium]